MKKDKLSKKKSKRRPTYANKEIPVIGILNKLPIEKPFIDFADALNPFSGINGYKSLMFSQLISKIYSFALDCANQVWLLGNDKGIKAAKELLYNKREEIESLIIELIPLEASKVPSHQYIRICEFTPQLLVNFVNHIRSKLKKVYADVRKDTKWRSFNKDWKRRRAVEIYLDKEFEEDFDLFCECIKHFMGFKPFKKKEKLLENMSVKLIYTRNDAYSVVAVRIVSCFANCSYDRLYEIYLNNKKTPTWQEIN